MNATPIRESLALLRAVAKRNELPLSTFRRDGAQCVGLAEGFIPNHGFLGWCWAFRDASDEEAAAILRFWLLHWNQIGYELDCHLGSLLAQKGRLVEDLLAPVLRDTDWSSYASPQTLLAGLAAVPDGAKRAVELLDIVPEDARDGLFIACWYLPALPVQRKLLAKFVEWSADPTWGGGTCEDGWLRVFLCKWISQGTFSLRRLAPLVQWTARHEYRFLLP
jgi:hypothetical protein